jgi:hypothetical protein
MKKNKNGKEKSDSENSEKLLVNWHFEEGVEQMTFGEVHQHEMHEALRMAKSEDLRLRRQGETRLSELARRDANATASPIVANLESTKARKYKAEEIKARIVKHHNELVSAGHSARNTTSLIVRRLKEEGITRGEKTVQNVLKKAGLK